MGDFTPQFDAAGNQTLVKTNTGIWRVTYNAENRPTHFENEDGSMVVQCGYDYMGRRCYKKVTTNGKVTLHQRYIYRGYLQIAAHDLTRSAIPAMWYILWDPTQFVATRPLAIQKDGTWYTYGWDLTKNITELYRQTGCIHTLYTYTPYGLVTTDGDVTQPVLWSSEFNDAELGLMYYNYRYYNPQDGRWINRDPIGISGGFNMYKFVDNNPSFVDVKGLFLQFVAGFIEGAITDVVTQVIINGITGKPLLDIDYNSVVSSAIVSAVIPGSSVYRAGKAIIQGLSKSYKTANKIRKIVPKKCYKKITYSKKDTAYMELLVDRNNKMWLNIYHEHVEKVIIEKAATYSVENMLKASESTTTCSYEEIIQTYIQLPVEDVDVQEEGKLPNYQPPKYYLD